MKKYPVSITFILACLLFILAGCEKENPVETIPFDMHRKYLLTELYANPPMDLNFDGIKTSDLTKEIGAFKDCYIYFTDKKITINWPEPQIDHIPFLTSELPSNYSGQNINYFAVPRYYTYSATHWNHSVRIYPTEIKEEEQENYYTFTAPVVMTVDEEHSTIMFLGAYQYFLTEEGRTGRQFIAVFKPDPSSIN
jgi:hypothetical protein